MTSPIFSRRPALTVLFYDDDAQSAEVVSTHALASKQIEVVSGGLTAGLRLVTGAWLLVVPTGTDIALTWTQTMLAAGTRRDGVVVGTDSPPQDVEEELRQALTSSGVLVRRQLTDDFVPPAPVGAEIALRAHAVAAASSLRAVPSAGGPDLPTPHARTGGKPPREAVGAWLDVFARLDEIGQRKPRVRRALLALKSAVATEVGRVVAMEPAIRLDVLGEVQQRGLRSFSTRMVNVETACELAIVYGFPPFLDTGGFVVSRRFDAQPDAYDVLTQDMSRRRTRDDRSLELARRNLGRRMVVREPLATGNWEQVERFCRAGMDRIAAREDEAGPYKAIYSRSMWIAPSVLGAWYKARHPGTPWTAELSDPIAHRPNGELRPNPFPQNAILDEIRAAVAAAGRPGWNGDRFFEGVEWMVYALADRIVFTNESQRDFMLGSFADAELAKRARAISVVEPHPVPAAELYTIGTPDLNVEPDRITIGYFGNFYGVRRVDDLLEPFAPLTAVERARFRLLVFTSTVDDVAESVRDHPAAESVRVLPAQPYFDFLALTRRMDWLVLADAHSPAVFPRNPFLPSKLADYRGSGTPIWGIVEPGSVLSSQQLDEKSTLGDAADGAAALRRILARAT